MSKISLSMSIVAGYRYVEQKMEKICDFKYVPLSLRED